MKCKFCGQELVVDNQTKVGVCVGCGKKFAISTVAKAKVCKVCNTDLVNKEVYWECPNCGKKYSFSKKKESDNNSQNTQNSNNGLDESSTQNNTTANEEYAKDYFDIDIDIDIGDDSDNSLKSVNSDESVIIPNNGDTEITPTIEEDEIIIPNNVYSNEDDVILPSDDSENIIIPSETDLPNVSEDELENDILDEDLSTGNSESELDNDILDDEVIDDSINQESEHKTEDEENILLDDGLNQTQEISESQSDFESEEVNNDNLDLSDKLTEPELYDENDNSRRLQYSNVHQVSSLNNMSNAQNKTSAKGISVLLKVFGILLGIVAVLAGVACYIFTHYDLVEKAINLSMGNLLPTIQKVSTFVFLAVFIIMLIISTLKNIGLKRIGTILGIISVIILILTVMFEKKLVEQNLYSYALYAGYAVLLFGSFLTMVIKCDSNLSKTANIMGIVLFVISLVSLLVVALQLVPLQALKLNSLEKVVVYLKDADKVLLGFASISCAVLIAKSE